MGPKDAEEIRYLLKLVTDSERPVFVVCNTGGGRSAAFVREFLAFSQEKFTENREHIRNF